ncbi:hypothetical protein T439DRAFT_360448 [Meredithblackwellia eburnea MCA 4105]
MSEPQKNLLSNNNRGIPVFQLRSREATVSSLFFPRITLQTSYLVISIRCSGPAPSAPGGGAQVIKRLRADGAHSPNPTQASPTPTSPNSTDWHLTSNQLSISLQYYLLREHFADSHKTHKEGPQERPKIEEIFQSVGKIDELAVVDELAVHSFAIRASYFSCHSALVGAKHSTLTFAGFASPPSRDFIEAGFQRHFVQDSLKRRIFNLLLQLPLVGTSLEINRFLLNTGITLLDHNDSEKLHLHIHGWMAEIVRDEMLTCLNEGQTTVCSPRLFRKICPKTLFPFVGFVTLSEQDLSLIRSSSTNPANEMEYAERRTVVYAVLDTWDRCLGYLSFHKASDSIKMLNKTWKLLSGSRACVAEFFALVSRGCTQPGQLSTRESDFLTWGLSFDTCGLEVMLGAHRLIQHSELDNITRTALLQLSKSQILPWMSQITKHYQILTYSTTKTDMAIARRIAKMFRAAGETLTNSWRCQNPHLEFLAKEAIMYSAFSGPTFSDLAIRFDIPPIAPEANSSSILLASRAQDHVDGALQDLKRLPTCFI